MYLYAIVMRGHVTLGRLGLEDRIRHMRLSRAPSGKGLAQSFGGSHDELQAWAYSGLGGAGQESCRPLNFEKFIIPRATDYAKGVPDESCHVPLFEARSGGSARNEVAGTE